MKRRSAPNTAAILRVHPSNYKIPGFTAEVPLAELVEIAHARGLVVDRRRGGRAAGGLLPLRLRQGADACRNRSQAGADLITASADKLIGASQGGIILGRADLIQAVRKNPLARIVRVGKLTLAALEATLSLFLDEAKALREVPTLRMLCRGLAEIAAQAERIAQAIGRRTSAAVVTTAEGFSQMGSGSLPTQNLPTRLVAIQSESVESGELACRLRRHRPPVFARVHKGQVLVDPRTLLEGEEQVLVEAFVQALRQGSDGFPNPSYTIR